MTPVEFILRFTFSHPDMDATIVGKGLRFSVLRLEANEGP